MSIAYPVANRDPRAFDNADRFDIMLKRTEKAIAFGGGVYYCLGAALARLEMAEGLCALTRRLSPPVLAAPVCWRTNAAFSHGPEALRVRFGEVE